MKRARRAVALILMLCMLLGMSAYAENELSCDIVEDWDASTDLMDAEKYQSTNCTLTLGSDTEVGGYVAMKATNYGPLLTVTAQFAAGKSVGVWVKQADAWISPQKVSASWTPLTASRTP
ncbi:hypothetical protein [Pseudoflavonifractor intestinihominis]|uniref:Uncharacterized protein n=1 Tax=Pseudoflavonifractor intestinihominis TaxID=3133171 RepID=A0ABV1E736_9FIRM|nr:hypothetical protein [uncultured Pseudoflavonifractor sp.]